MWPPVLPSIGMSTLAALLLVGCSRAPLGEGLPEVVAKALQPCLEQTGPVRDHCAVTLASHLDLAGAEWMTLCGQLAGGTAYDLCVERAAWAKREPAPHTVCAKISEERTRQSCLLGATNAIIAGPIAALVDVCARTEDLEDDCWVHVSTERRKFWLDSGAERLSADVAEAVKLRSRLARSVPFASEVGIVQAQLPPSSATACDSFELDIPQMTCVNNLRGALR